MRMRTKAQGPDRSLLVPSVAFRGLMANPVSKDRKSLTATFVGGAAASLMSRLGEMHD
jgi:hypothetical protein